MFYVMFKNIKLDNNKTPRIKTEREIHASGRKINGQNIVPSFAIPHLFSTYFYVPCMSQKQENFSHLISHNFRSAIKFHTLPRYTCAEKNRQ